MIIELHGAGFQNKGAELMLRATLSELRRRLSSFQAAIDPGYGPYLWRCELGLNQIVPLRSHVGSKGFYYRFQAQKLFALFQGERIVGKLLGTDLCRLGCVSLSRIDALVDIAGFAYTEEWGARPTQHLAMLTSYYRRRGCPVILLPQALGPFRSQEIRLAFRKVLANSTLVFARDEESYGYVNELSPDPSKVRIAPDITLFYPPETDSGVASPRENAYACVVPNSRLLDQGRERWGDKYRQLLLLITKELLRSGLQVKVAIHDASPGDLALGHYLCERSSSSAVALIQEVDPFKLKQVISGSTMVVGSRYHSLVAAFSRRVPAVCLGWAHKYEALFRDFGCQEYIISPQDQEESVLDRIRKLADPEINSSCRDRIGHYLQRMREPYQRMWSLVIDILNRPAGAG
jgi:polysaccharide pyruvyl transferase WcaK-like protein